MPRIDPIVVKEAQVRMAKKAANVSKGAHGAAGLLWFHGHALTGAQLLETGVLEEKSGVRIIASATPDAKIAQEYVDRATRYFHKSILERAIELAQNDFDVGDA